MQRGRKNISWFNVLVLGLTLSLFSCQKEDIGCLVYSEDAQIRYGTSFGMCVGYCTKEYEFSEALMKLTQSGRNVPTVTCTREMNEQRWKEMIIKVDIQKLKDLPDRIGCPDCADGGAEWIEVFDGTTRHKVVFEYHKEPEELKSLLTDVRAIAASISCDDK